VGPWNWGLKGSHQLHCHFSASGKFWSSYRLYIANWHFCTFVSCLHINVFCVSTSLQAVYRCWFGWWRCSWVRGSWDDENFGWIPHLESIAFLMCALRVHINKSIFGKVLLGIEKIVDKTFSKISLLMCAHRAHISKILFIISLNVIKILCYCSFFWAHLYY